MSDAPRPLKDPTAAERSRRYRARKRALVQRDGVTGRATAMVPAESVTATVTNVTVMPPQVCGGRFLTAVLIITGIALGAIGIVLNAAFASSLGQSSGAAVLLAGIGMALDVLGMLLPATGAELWRHGQRFLALVAWGLWPCVMTMVLLSAVGFAAGNLGDAIAGRERDALAGVNLRAELNRARAERTTIAEARSADEIEAAIARTRVPDWARPCVAPDTAEARRACDPVMKLRQSLETSRRRGVLDSQVRDAEMRLAALPAVGLADPVAFAADIITWASAGRLTPTAADVYRIRIIGLVIAPSLAGVVLMLAMGVVASRHHVGTILSNRHQVPPSIPTSTTTRRSDAG